MPQQELPKVLLLQYFCSAVAATPTCCCRSNTVADATAAIPRKITVEAEDLAALSRGCTSAAPRSFIVEDTFADAPDSMWFCHAAVAA